MLREQVNSEERRGKIRRLQLAAAVATVASGMTAVVFVAFGVWMVVLVLAWCGVR